jgi:hypothetical protein
MSPYLKQGIGIALMLESGYLPHTGVSVGCIDGKLYKGQLAELPLYDKAGAVQHGRLIELPMRD